jgi:hypothetical protein
MQSELFGRAGGNMRRAAVAILTVLTLSVGLRADESTVPPAVAPAATDPAAPAVPASPAAMFDLSKTAGLDRYTGPDAGRALLARQGLLISPESEPQLFSFYYGGKLPYFITTDTALHAYGVVLERGFKALESKRQDSLREFQEMLWRAVAEGRENPGDKEVIPWPTAPRNSAATMIAVASRLLNPEWLPPKGDGIQAYEVIRKDVDAELARIKAGVVAASPLFDQMVDYSLLKPRGFYADDGGLACYFQARAFWALPMNLDDDAAMRTAVVLGLVCNDYGTGRLTEPYRLLIGGNNLPSAQAIVSELPGAITLSDVNDEKSDVRRLLGNGNLDETRAELRRKLAVPLVPIGMDLEQVIRDVTSPAEGPPLRACLWPQPALPDSALMARNVWPHVPEPRYPGGLDVLAALGNDRAMELLLAAEPEANRAALKKTLLDTRLKWPRLHRWRDRPDRAADRWAAPLQEGEPGEVDEMADVEQSAVWFGLTRVFETLQKPATGKRHPRFMTTPAYADKSINTALAAWATYRHTFVLHSASMSFFGGEPDPPPGYVEPNVRFWQTMDDLAMHTYAWLHDEDVDVGDLVHLALLCRRAKAVAEKQLAGRPLNDSDRTWLRNYGYSLADLCGFHTNMLSVVSTESGVVVDIGTDRAGANVLYAATGRPRAVYVIMDYGGKLQLARGGVTSYREFTRPLAGGRLDDAAWRRMLTSGREPSAPPWLAALGADYTVESVTAAAREGRVSYDILDRYPSQAAADALLDHCRQLEEKGTHAAWPPDEPQWLLARFILKHPECVDRAFVERYVTLAEKYHWDVAELPSRADWLDYYLALAERWKQAPDHESRHRDIATVIGRTDSPKVAPWLKATMVAMTPEGRHNLLSRLTRNHGIALPDASADLLTEHLLSLLAQHGSANQDDVTAANDELPAEYAVEYLARLWPYWKTHFDEAHGEVVCDGAFQYAPARATIRAKAVAGLAKFAQRTATRNELWENPLLLVHFALCLGPEAATSAVATRVAGNEEAAQFAQTEAKGANAE